MEITILPHEASHSNFSTQNWKGTRVSNSKVFKPRKVYQSPLPPPPQKKKTKKKNTSKITKKKKKRKKILIPKIKKKKKKKKNPNKRMKGRKGF